MSPEASESISEFCQEEAGEYLQGVYHYDNGEYNALYLRDDVAEQYTETEFTNYFELLGDADVSDTQQEETLHVGTHQATLRLYDDALIFQFPQGEGISTLISLDPAAGRTIATFVVRCLERLHRASEQDIQNAPTWGGFL